MMEKIAVLKKDILTDLIALTFALLVPPLSHLTSVPFYLADPMRMAALGVLVVTKDWKNSLLFALMLPLFSTLVSGHPIFPKCLLISVELGSNVLLLTWLSQVLSRLWPFRSGITVMLAAFVSILVSKGLYYLLKLSVISAGLMQMELVSTAIWIQLVAALFLSLAFALVATRADRE